MHVNGGKYQANVTGSQSQKWKVDKIKSLLVRAKGNESKYIIRGLQGKLRIGLAKNTVLASLSHAVVLTKPRGVVDLTDEQLAQIRRLDGTDGTLRVHWNCVTLRLWYEYSVNLGFASYSVVHNILSVCQPMPPHILCGNTK